MNANSSLIMQKYNSVQRFLTSARQAKISPQEVPYPNHNPAQVSALIRIHLYAKKCTFLCWVVIRIRTILKNAPFCIQYFLESYNSVIVRVMMRCTSSPGIINLR